MGSFYCAPDSEQEPGRKVRRNNTTRQVLIPHCDSIKLRVEITELYIYEDAPRNKNRTTEYVFPPQSFLLGFGRKLGAVTHWSVTAVGQNLYVGRERIADMFPRGTPVSLAMGLLVRRLTLCSHVLREARGGPAAVMRGFSQAASSGTTFRGIAT